MFNFTIRLTSGRILLAMLFMAWLACLTTPAAAGEDEPRSIATASRFDRAPTLDGVVEPGEWDGAVQTTGYLSLKGDWLERGMGRTYVGFTRDRLYVAIISELPPTQELKATKTARDSKLILQDSFEIWLNPYRQTDDGQKAGGTYFQAMGIANGVISDTKFTGEGAPDIGWNGDWQFVNKLHKNVDEGPEWMKRHGVWVAELSVPFEDLGWEGDPTGRSIGVQIARNFKGATSWKQPTWLPHSGSFVSWFEYPEIKLTDNAPSVQIERWGENVFDGQIELLARIHNPGPARRAVVNLLITSTDMPNLEQSQTIDLPANGEATYEYKVPEGRLHETAKHQVNVEVLSEDGETAYLRYRAGVQQRGRFWAVRTGPNPRAAVRLAYYPTYKFIRVRVAPAELGQDAEGITSGNLTLKAPNGDVLLEKKLSWTESPAEIEFDVGELPGGQYTAVIELDGYDEQSFERTFRRTHFVWEGNNLGKTSTVLPPFEPIEVDGGNVSVVMRAMRQDGLGLWSSVEALGNSSGPKELLAGPMRFVADGEAIDGEGQFTDTADHEVVYEGRASTPAVNVQTRCITEYDGCMKVELTLKPGAGDKPLESFHLDIPIKDAVAPLWHCSTTELRRNPVGATPAGTGRVWDSRDFPDGEWYGNFHPYLWVGGEERGLCFFADNDHNWVTDVDLRDPAQSAPSQELIRRDGVLTMRIHFVQKPVTLQKPRTIVFGLMASPGKPMMKNWRNILLRDRKPGHRNLMWIGSTYWGTREVMAETYPINRDMSILTKMQEARLTGNRNAWRGFLEVWAERNLTGEWPEHGRMLGTPAKSKKLARISVQIAAAASDPEDFLNVYWEAFHNVSRNHPETQVFRNEWSGSYSGNNVHSLARSYLDFQCWYGAEFIRRGIGLYFDNTFPKRAYDPVTSNAYRLPNGRIQPSANMWRHREYLKRIWVLHQQLAPSRTPPIMMVHMTNTHILPYMTFNESNLDLEWFYGPEPAQSKYPHTMLRAQTLGRQTGNVPLALAKVGSNDERAQRTKFGALFVHEIKFVARAAARKLLYRVLDFGYGRDGCRVYNYWDDDAPLASSDEQCKWLLMERGGNLMLLLCTWNDSAHDVTLTFDTKALGVDVKKATDAETGESLEVSAKRITVSMPGYGVRMVEVQ